MDFVNISNHPSCQWRGKQLEEACKLGRIIDLPFPDVPPEAGEVELRLLADSLISSVLNRTIDRQAVIHIMGEMTLTYLLVHRFKALGFKCVASTTRRISYFQEDGQKVSKFDFVSFREYIS